MSYSRKDEFRASQRYHNYLHRAFYLPTGIGNMRQQTVYPIAQSFNIRSQRDSPILGDHFDRTHGARVRATRGVPIYFHPPMGAGGREPSIYN